MFVLVVGAGRVGSSVATSALRAGHTVSVLDEDPLSHERLDVELGQSWEEAGGRFTIGTALELDALVEAGIDEAEVFIASTTHACWRLDPCHTGQMSELDGLWLFGELAQADRALVLRSTHRHRYPAGTYLYHAGELGDSLHIVVKGRLAALAGSDLSEPMMLNLLGPGEVFGELALFNADHRRRASIVAVETSECLVLYRDAVQQLRRRHPQVNDMLLSVLVHRVERLTVQVAELFELDAPTRVYRQLVRLGETYEATGHDGEIPLTQQQVASLSGVKLRVTNRVLNEARADGVLTTGKRRVIVHDWPTVRRRAGLRPTDA